MVGAPGFSSWQEMQSSEWLSAVKDQMDQGHWPIECQRCQATEPAHSIRLGSIQRDQVLSKFDPDYIILGGVLDNICNSACQSCSARLSTKIGSLTEKNYIKTSNKHLIETVPSEHIVEIDLNGGEPTASPAYQNLLENLPPNVKVLRVNTNGSKILPNIDRILESKVQLIITLSLDGVDNVHDYVRWPIKWNKYVKTVERYIEYRNKYRNLKLEAWTTVHSLNVCDFNNIETFTKKYNINHSWAFLVDPDPLNAMYSNQYTETAKQFVKNKNIVEKLATLDNNQKQLEEFINQQDQLRNISIKDYL